jgi:hypothetical protein
MNRTSNTIVHVLTDWLYALSHPRARRQARATAYQ